MPDYEYSEGDGAYRETFHAASDDEANEVAREKLRTGEYEQTGKTFRVEAHVTRIGRGGGEVDGWYVRCTFDPPEPPCVISPGPPPAVSPDGHDWQTPHELVGGLEENPGVFSSGHGQIRTEWACSMCGAGRTDDGGDTDPANGDCMATVEYQPPGHYPTARPVYWSVVTGTPGPVAAVDPLRAGVAIPDDVLKWAAGHGLDQAEAGRDVFVMVATEDEAGEIPGEIAYRKGTVSYAGDQAIRAALAAANAERREVSRG